VDGTQLAAISENGDVIAWNYQSGNILFQQNLSERVARIEWNPFNPNLFATFQWVSCFFPQLVLQVLTPSILS
jgi:hypothetical protein